eukprot:1634876-Alexandrium_andersonii.AAC.1
MIRDSILHVPIAFQRRAFWGRWVLLPKSFGARKRRQGAMEEFSIGSPFGRARDILSFTRGCWGCCWWLWRGSQRLATSRSDELQRLAMSHDALQWGPRSCNALRCAAKGCAGLE